MSSKYIKICGVNLPYNKKSPFSLSYIYGIGVSLALKILKELNLDPEKRMKDFSESELDILRRFIESKYTLEGDLRREVSRNIKRLTSIRCYRGLRHKSGLPVRGQRTKTNARTRKGKRKLTSAIKKK